MVEFKCKKCERTLKIERTDGYGLDDSEVEVCPCCGAEREIEETDDW